MRATIYWIEAEMAGRLGIMARPRSGDWLEDEVAAWRADGVDTVVSLLDAEEIEELELGHESAVCGDRGIEFVGFPIFDRDVPDSSEAVSALVQRLILKIKAGRAVAVHCRAGIGRSSLIAACVMVSCGICPDVAFQRIGDARGVTVPDTESQRIWVEEFYQRRMGMVQR